MVKVSLHIIMGIIIINIIKEIIIIHHKKIKEIKDMMIHIQEN
jgi:hypothetical protein